jgi:preprotein translocase subunit SecA
LRERVIKSVDDAYAAKVESVGAPVMRHLEKAIMLQELDRHWREHLAAMDYLRQGIHLRAYAQKNPKQEYKREAFELFNNLLDRIKHDTVSLLSRLQVRNEAEIEEQQRERERQLARKLQLQHAAPPSAIGDVEAAPAGALGGLAAGPGFAGGFGGGAGPSSGPLSSGPTGSVPSEPVVRDGRKVGRNEPCPCGSGKKYKHCHGQLAREA